MIGECNLCKKTKELQRVCHVIPEFFYRDSDLYHDHHNLVSVDLKLFLETGKVRTISSKQKQGEYDQYTICYDCDGIVINKYETYTREFFYSDSLPKSKELIKINHNEFIECLNADYKLLKLLFLSILWRASISKRPLFSEIKLDTNTQEELRLMILNGNPKDDTEYPIFIMNTIFDNTTTNDFLFQPIKMKFGNENGFMFAFGGMIIIFTNGIDGIPENILKYRLQQNGIFRSMKLQPGETWRLIIQWYKK